MLLLVRFTLSDYFKQFSFQTFSWLLEQSDNEVHIHQVTWEISNLLESVSEAQNSSDVEKVHLPHLIMVRVYLIV